MRTLCGALLLGLTSVALALPEGGQVVQGNLQISQPGAQILQILQSSPTGIINWGSFSIDANQLVQFLQPNSSAALLNRVVGQDPSQILGQLQANGRILLVNPNGMLFGPGSSVNAGSFLASTLSIKDQDFLQGRYDLSWDGTSPLRAIVNQGEIRVADGGFLALISPLIDNQGLLLAERGQVVVGATRQATLTVDARGLLQVVIPDGFSAHAGARSQPQTVVLTQGQMSDTLAQLVNHTSQQEGAALVDTPQGIQLVGGEGLLLNQGSIRADATLGTAGSVLLDSSQATVLAPEGVVSASSLHGDGGEIRALSAGTTVQTGGLQARSLAAGNGGFVEVSAARIGMTRGADVSAAAGVAGTMLLDPDNITIVAGPPGPPVGNDIDVSASALNVTGTVQLMANQNITFNPSVRVNIDGSTQLQLDAGGNIDMLPGSGINATHTDSSVVMNAAGFVNLRDLQIPTSHINGGTFIQFNNGTVGQPGGNTTLTAISGPGGTALFAGNRLDVVGQTVTVDLSSTASNVAVADGSQLNLAGTNSNNLTATCDNEVLYVGQNSSITGASDTDIHFNSASNVIVMRDGSSIDVTGKGQITMVSGVNVILQAGSTINATGPGSRLDIDAGNAAHLNGDAAVPTVNVTAGGELDLSGSLGRSGSPTLVNASGASVFFFNNTDIKGSQVDWKLHSTGGDIILVNDANIHVEGNNNRLDWNASANILMGTNSTFSADGSTRLGLTSGARTLMLANSTLSLPGAGSNISVNSVGAPVFNRVISGGRFSVDASAGNVRITDQVEANDIVINGTQGLIDTQTDIKPAVIAHHSLNVTVANISGPIDDPANGIVQAFPFATDANTQVRFNVSGTNATTLGNRAANLYYYFPQSGDIQIVHPNGDVAIYNQPGPPPAPPSGTIDSRADLSAEQFEEVTHVGAQSQIQLSNLYSADYLPSTSDVLMLAYDNPGLTNFSLIPLSSALVELVVLSPDSAARQLGQRESSAISLFSDEEDEQLRYWRKLIQGFIIWEADL